MHGSVCAHFLLRKFWKESACGIWVNMFYIYSQNLLHNFFTFMDVILKQFNALFMELSHFSEVGSHLTDQEVLYAFVELEGLFTFAHDLTLS